LQISQAGELRGPD